MLDEQAMTVLRAGLAAYGLDVSRAEALGAYLDAVLEKNRVMNLTAITEPVEAVRLHLLDCAALVGQYDFRGKSVVDVGCGAGLPGLPIRLTEPSARLTLLDATEKKIAFLRGLAPEDVQCVSGRAEELAAKTGPMRERFDVAVSRAVAALPVLVELCLPFVRVGGCFCAMKARAAEEELRAAGCAIRTLGGEVRACRRYIIPGTDAEHCAIWIEKTRPCPAAYPRRFTKIRQRPL